MSAKPGRSLSAVFLGSIIVAGFLAYLPTFSGDFILDDIPLIKNNTYIRELHSVSSYLSQEDGMSETKDLGETRTGYYRPIVLLTYWLDYRVWGMSGPGFRASNLALHLIASMLLFLVVSHLVKNRQAAFWAAMYFVLHPVNTEAVSWVSSRNNILAAVFALACFHAHVLAWEKEKTGYLLLSLFFFALSLFSKEFGLVLLPLLFLWWMFFHYGKKSFSEGFRTYLPFLFVLIGYLLLRYGATGFLPPSEASEPLWRRAAFAPYLAALNLRLILLPFDLHSFAIGYPDSILFHALSGILIAGVLCFFFLRTGNPLFRFSLLSFFCALLPVLHLVPVPSASLVSMRWLYFPMVFLLIGLSSAIKSLLGYYRFAAIGTLCLVCAYLGIFSFVLNRTLWHDEEGFFRMEVDHFENTYYAGGLASVYFQKKDYRKAEKYFQMAAREGHATAGDLINYGALLTETGRFGDAQQILGKARKYRMGFKERGQLHNNLGMALFRLNKTAEAVKHFRKAVIFFPGEPVFWANLGGGYGSAGDYQNSTLAFRRGLGIQPDSMVLRKGLALTLLKMQDYPSAIAVLEQIPEAQRGDDMDIVRMLEQVRSKRIDSSRAAGGE